MLIIRTIGDSDFPTVSLVRSWQFRRIQHGWTKWLWWART